MATVGRFPLSHSCANADSLGNPASTGQDTPRSPRHPAESARPLHHHPDAGRRPVARTKRRHQHQIRRAGNRDGGRLGHGNVQRTPDKELKRRTQPGPCSRESRGSREGGEVSEETQDGPGRILSTIQCLGSAGPDRFSLRLLRLLRATISFANCIVPVYGTGLPRYLASWFDAVELCPISLGV